MFGVAGTAARKVFRLVSVFVEKRLPLRLVSTTMSLVFHLKETYSIERSSRSNGTKLHVYDSDILILGEPQVRDAVSETLWFIKITHKNNGKHNIN